MTNQFHIGQTVKGHKAGTFAILGFRTIGGEEYAQIKEINPETGAMARGEFALPVSCLRAIGEA